MRFLKYVFAAFVFATVFGSAAQSAPATPVQQYATISDVNCATVLGDSGCAVKPNVLIDSVTVGTSSIRAYYSWSINCAGGVSPDGVGYFRPTGATVGCYIPQPVASSSPTQLMSIADIEALKAGCRTLVTSVWVPFQGHYAWNGSSTATADGVNILQCTGVATGRMIIDEGPLALASITAMQNLPGPVANMTVDVAGTQGGRFIATTVGSACVTDGGTKWPANDGTLICWQRQYSGALYATWYGCVSGGTVDCTTPILNATSYASSQGGNVVQLPVGIVKTIAPIANVSGVDIEGAGTGVTILKPTGTYAYAIGCVGASFASYASNCRIGNMSIDGSAFTGINLWDKYCAQRCWMHDIYSYSTLGTANSTTQGVACAVYSSFDHDWDRVECRASASYPVEVIENEAPYEEQSNIKFYDVSAIGGNSGGIQWYQYGGDSDQYWIKASEGSVGFECAYNANNLIIHSQYFDDPGTGLGVAIDTNANYCQQIHIENVFGYNNKYNVQITRGQNIFIGHSVGNTATPVHITTTATAPIFLLEPNTTYLDDNATSIVYPALDTGTWTPTVSGTGAFTLGNGTLVATYARTGNKLQFNITLTIGTTTTLPTSGMALGLPPAFPPKTGTVFTGSVTAQQASTTNDFFTSNAYINSSTNSVLLPTGGGASTFYSSTIPFAWAATDVLRVSGSYTIN